MSEPTLIKIHRPPGCDKTSLSIDALDSKTRDLAWQTFLYVEGKPLLCRSLKLTDKGTLLVEVLPACFEFADSFELKSGQTPE